MLKKKGKYGLKAMVYLAQFPPRQPVGVQEIASSQNISRKFLDTILAELKIKGFVFSKKGVGGGYGLALPADKIMVGDIIRTINGPLAPIACASKTRYMPCDDCPDEKLCAVRMVMIRAQQKLSELFDNFTLAQMCALSKKGARRKSAISEKRCTNKHSARTIK